MNDDFAVNDDNQPSAALPLLPPYKLSRRCQTCNQPFETRFYSLEHCVCCSINRLTTAPEGTETAGERRDRERKLDVWEHLQQRYERKCQKHAEALRQVAQQFAEADRLRRQHARRMWWFNAAVGTVVLFLLERAGR